eukprot:GCRY01003000.1.p1 GENE.GCRY01003000.1~~GCRY01003000.1.p1  ORF type:complete len:468 (+),score=81.00 GCRY01003000.1:179-1582(+)
MGEGDKLDNSLPSHPPEEERQNTEKDIKTTIVSENGSSPSIASEPVPPIPHTHQTAVEPGVLAPCRWKGDNEYYKAEIIEFNPVRHPTEHYYVHYIDFNRRLDEWISLDRINLGEIDTSKLEEKRKKALESIKKEKKQQKQKKGSAAGTENSDFPEATEGGEDEPVATPAPSAPTGGNTTVEHEFMRVKNVETVVVGPHEVQAWYYSPYPPDVTVHKKIWVCEFCLKAMSSSAQLHRHVKKCTLRHPPGNEIYRKDAISVFEVDGDRQRLYSQNLALFAKMFLDHKTLYFDVDPFMFYVMCECSSRGAHIVGYFSKEKESVDDYNVACICTFPQHQRKGFGRLLIQFSYELSKVEGRVGSPEKPLSDLGLLSYRSYWLEVIIEMLKDLPGPISIKEICEATSIKTEDILNTLQAHHLLRYVRGRYVFALTPDVIERHENMLKKQKRNIDPSCLQWTPVNDYHKGQYY